MMPNKSVSAIREDYNKDQLLEDTVLKSPFLQFENWFQAALDNAVMEPNAMVLSSVNEEGRPSSRIVLLKGFDEVGFSFFTNYESKKGQELMQNPVASLLFFWPELQRQVRIEGEVKKLSAAESDAYFQSRPKASRLGAWASPQSQPIANREVLNENMRKLEEDYANQDFIPKPPHWGGFIVQPILIEFWQGRSSRLHDRLVYKRGGLNTNDWILTRLAP